MEKSKRKFYSKPAVITEWENEEDDGHNGHSTSWEESFIDLIFVAAINRMSLQFLDGINETTLSTVFLFFIVFWWTWNVLTGFNSRFICEN